ncbi:hypothetical protein MKQ70_27940 [Chitinophaga sedimenti]|nr:hypothetical protein [Chitinophaga sedimenti]MCK7558620.1 hypothetical protein [Chitinophaga sedimenti]
MPAVLLAACENPPRPGETAADSIVLQTDTLPHGFYEDSPASGAIVRLTLTKSGEARLVTDYQNFTPELIQIGSLQSLDSNRLMVSLVKVGSGDPVKDTMTLLWQRDTLVYTGNAYGSEQMLLVAREKPAPVPKDLVVWIKIKVNVRLGPASANPSVTRCNMATGRLPRRRPGKIYRTQLPAFLSKKETCTS